MERKGIQFILLTLVLILVCYAKAHENIFDITQYGATPEADINMALHNAWKDAIASEGQSKIVIPTGTWKLSEAVLEGPSLAQLHLELKGTILANPYIDTTSLGDQPDWINIRRIEFFTLSGGGVLDGQGQLAWQMNNCKADRDCKKLPRNLIFNSMSHSVIRDVTSKDSKFFHILCHGCTNVTFNRVTVSAPSDSPNTDGINLARSKEVRIYNSVIGTGDDCISMGNDLAKVDIRHVTCGPGHGISIGSLGKKADEKDVTEILVRDCKFINTTNGVRIKTWPSTPGTLRVSSVHFEDLVMENAANPIIIDQEYCPSNQCDPTNPSLVEISGVTIKNVTGSTSSKKGVTLLCSSTVPCAVTIGNVDLTYNGNGGEIDTTCVNVNPTFLGAQNPAICAT